jgi:4-diphosphocytidyl-2-C-methyl-D-erythritol kinase
MLRRALGATLGDRAERVFGAAGVDPSARAETLTLTEWAALAHAASTGVRFETKLDAYAKLTLSLHVTGTRANGMHELDALVVSVSAPRDELVIRAAPETAIAVTGPFAAGVPTDGTNLAVRAAHALGTNVAIELHKGIPHGAGLGGGSADAAAVLVGAPAVTGVDVHYLEVERIAASLGADVPFCLTGGAMRMSGIGEELEPVNLPDLAIVIATPPFGCATADVYRAWDELGCPLGNTVAIEGMPPLRNDLEPAAHHVEPRLAAFKAAIERATGVPALLAGSGSSYALVFHDIAAAEDARARIAETLDGQVVVGLTVDTGVRERL